LLLVDEPFSDQDFADSILSRYRSCHVVRIARSVSVGDSCSIGTAAAAPHNLLRGVIGGARDGSTLVAVDYP
jgi:hypothetical protein